MQPFKINLPDEVRFAIDALEQHGHDAYVVGGCVRDSIMGRKPHDWDITTNATPARIQKVFSGFPQALDGLKHGTVTIILDHKPVEITTYRIDGNYSDGRRPDTITFTSDLIEDLARRDFTINACAYGREGLIDPFGGEHDIKTRLIRCVGDPVSRFNEDALRILRGMRFASQLSFTVENKTKEAMMKCTPLLKKISQERITDELSKTLMGINVQNVLNEFRDVLLFLIPELEQLSSLSGNAIDHTDLLSHSIRAIAIADRDLALRIALLLRGIGKSNSLDHIATSDDKTSLPNISAKSVSAQSAETSVKAVEKILKRMRFPIRIIKQVTIIIRYVDEYIAPTPAGVKRILRYTGIEPFRLLLKAKRALASSENYPPEPPESSRFHNKTKLQYDPKHLNMLNSKEIDALESILDTVIEQNACIFLSDLAVSGNDLIAVGIPQGKKIGEILNRLLDLVIEGKVENKKDALLAEARRLMH